MNDEMYNEQTSLPQSEYQQQLDDKAALDSIELQEKTIEPDNKVSGNYAIRNYQFGNIKEEDLRLSEMRVNLAKDWLKVPKARGGWLLHKYGDLIFTKLDIYFIMSNSVNGMARRNEKTLYRVNDQRNTPKGKRTLFGNSEVNNL